MIVHVDGLGAGVILLALAVGTPAFRLWLKAFIDGRVGHDFDRRLETVRSEFRQSEERLKSELQQKATDIETLRAGALSGRSARVGLIQQKQIEAADRLWLMVTKLMHMKGPAMMLSMLKVDEISKRAGTTPNIRQFLTTLDNNFGGSDFQERMAEIRTDELRPFLSDYAWALFSAYSIVILGGYTILKLLSINPEDITGLIDTKKANDILKAALPHRSDYIDKYGQAGHVQLLEELEQKLLAETRKIIDGADVDHAHVEQAAKIMQVVDDAARAAAAAKVNVLRGTEG